MTIKSVMAKILPKTLFPILQKQSFCETSQNQRFCKEAFFREKKRLRRRPFSKRLKEKGLCFAEAKPISQRLFALAKRLLQKQNIARIAVICAVLLFIALKLPAFQSEYLDRDEPWYAWQSLVIYKNPADILMPEVNYPHYSLFPAIAAPLNALFPPPIPVRVTSFAFGSVALFFIYLIGKRLFSEKAGLAAVVLTILSPSFYFYSTRGIMDIPITALSAVVLYLLITLNKKRVIPLAGTLVAMYLIKTTSMIILPAVALFLLINYRKKVNKKQAITGIAVLIILATASLALSPHNWGYVFLTIFWAQDFGLFLIKMTQWSAWLLIGPFMALFALAGILHLRRKHDANTGLLFLWVACVYIILLLTGSGWIRYYLQAVPALAVVAGHGFVKLFEKRKVFAALVATAALALFLWGYYWDVVYWEMPERIFYFRDSIPFHKQKWDNITNWFATNVGEDDVLVIVAEKFVARGIVLAAEIGLTNARQQMIINPKKEAFEAIVKQQRTDLFLATDDLSPRRKIWDVSWLYALDVNSEAYLSSLGFDKVTELPTEFEENYIIYKNSQSK